MVGLLSVLDAFLDQPLEQIVSAMGLADDIADALISKGGELGAALDAVITCERADWDPLSLTTFGAQQLRDTYIESIAWATETKASLVG
jgi:EAL and modified HD-GYP domain-containing signal transduction protein